MKEARTKMDVATGILLPHGCYVNAHITGPAEGIEGILSVSWEIKSQRNKQVKDRARTPRTHIYRPATEDWPTAISMMVNRAVQAYYQECSTAHTAADAVKSATPYTDAIADLTDGEMRVLRPNTWSERTWRLHWCYFVRICAELDRQHAAEHANDRGVDYDVLCAVREAIIHQIVVNQRTKNPQRAEKTMDIELRATQYCMHALIDTVNERAGRIVLPPTDLAATCAWNSVPKDCEQAKWIPIAILVRLVEICFRVIANGKIMGIVLMLCLGLRTGEACAVKYGDFMWMKDGCVYRVRHQGAKRDKRLKSPDAYRNVYGGRLLADLLRARMAYLRGIGYSDDAIRQMFVASAEDCPTQPITDEGALSEFARRVLSIAGYTEEDFARATRLMKIEPDYESDGVTPIKSVAVYVFRRNLATMLVCTCDMLPGSNVVDAYLGHKSRYPQTVDYSNPSVIKHTLIPCLERIVLAPEHTSNPLYRSIVPGEGTKDYKGFAAYQFCADKDMDVEFELETAEPNQLLLIKSDASVTLSDIKREQGTEIAETERAVRSIVLLPPTPSEFAAYLKDLDKVDVSGLLPPAKHEEVTTMDQKGESDGNETTPDRELGQTEL